MQVRCLLVITPALAAKNPVVKVRRKRLTLAEWKTIFKHAGNMQPAAQNAMLLALITGQRLGDIVDFKFSDVWDGFLHITQNKTGSKIALPLSLRCDAIGMTLEEVDSLASTWFITQFCMRRRSQEAKYL